MTTTPTTPTSASSSSPEPGGGPGLVFPPGFVWGAATAAYQIEGGVDEGGRTPSIWDTFCRVPGAVAAGDTGDVACDHYHRWQQDVDLMASLGLGAYRFSTAWSRICPEPGVVNRQGLDFYSRLVDALLERGITPWLTLYHWDLPQALEDRGGWASRDVVDHFVEYATVVHDALGDRVTRWTTLNEPWCSAFLGYAGGQHAPGRQEPQAAVSAAHHLLLAHGHATRALRAAGTGAEVGLTVNLSVYDPADPGSDADQALVDRHDALLNRVFLDPVIHGRYPQTALDAWAAVGVAPPVRDGDMDVIATPLDMIGVNYYTSSLVSAETSPEPPTPPPGRTTAQPMVGVGQVRTVPRDVPRTAMGWEVQPDDFARLLRRVHADWTGPAGVPLYVTENGAAFDDAVGADGSVDDPERVAYLRGHLRAVHQAVTGGVDLHGYFVWSLLDNFEWAYGYAKRFGIVHVDFDTQRRTPKTSARVYSRVASTSILDVDGTVTQ
ncbi:beta-glucosidase [Cellulomonas bogoriensis 69B4 = DSM 16987]|uniref:Beta-glucosidase n=1 Tax=Cellulomonas bogoriensis 69B4 = DSM 16987 TaxID=1386082 RepID=A0A0A0BZ90_9CELL|nr:GH1 family beta-glucosidase [Cellulomonas bogoriensis]KGM13032.1 beta-glucosidase [Cellulomonas bogoriensis 69B4 = DSM 16987]